MAGFTAIKAVILIAVVILVALHFFPKFNGGREQSASDSCVNNLRLIDAAKQQWMLEHNITDSNVIPSVADLQPYMRRGTNGTLPYCPLDKTKSFTSSYLVNDLKSPPQCRMTNLDPRHKLLP
jgi:competence protein ComGC